MQFLSVISKNKFQFVGKLKIPDERSHFDTWSTTMYRALCEARPGGARHEREGLFSFDGKGLFPAGSYRPGEPRYRPAGGRIIGTAPSPRHPGQAERGTVCCHVRRLPSRREIV